MKEDLTGKVFGKIKVICKDKNRSLNYYHWLCRCSCGKEKVLHGYYLKNKKIQSCGGVGCKEQKGRQVNHIDLTDKIIGNIEVVSIKEKIKKGIVWNCKCKLCGKLFFMRADSLLRKTRFFEKNCGCSFRKGRHLSEEKGKKSLIERIYKTYKENARKRSLSWELNLNQVESLINKKCHYCGVDKFSEIRSSNGYYKLSHNGIDRVDNKGGYNIFNCVTCCKICNYAKRSMTVDEFMGWIGRLVKNREPLSCCDIKAVSTIQTNSSVHHEGQR